MAFLVPVFLLVILAEIIYGLKTKSKIYDLHESLSHLCTGVGQQVFNLIWFSGLIIAYSALQARWGYFVWPSTSPWTWVAVLLLTDFCWYWGHRASHRINIFVASHVTHHQAEDFNHGSALRQSWTSRPMMFLFFLPVAFVGISAEMLLFGQIISGFIQFLTHNGVHTRRLKAIDWLFVIPRTHLVHHGQNEPYLDKNFGGMFIFWDKWFGSFQDLSDKAAVQIGSSEKINHLDAVEANLNYYKRMIWISLNSKSTAEKFLIWFQSPETLSKALQNYGYHDGSVQSAKRQFSGKATGALFVLVLFQIVSVVSLMILWNKTGDLERIILSLWTLALVIGTSRLLYVKNKETLHAI
jgi:alkylglycerol monooxygenase